MKNKIFFLTLICILMLCACDKNSNEKSNTSENYENQQEVVAEEKENKQEDSFILTEEKKQEFISIVETQYGLENLTIKDVNGFEDNYLVLTTYKSEDGTVHQLWSCIKGEIELILQEDRDSLDLFFNGKNTYVVREQYYEDLRYSVYVYDFDQNMLEKLFSSNDYTRVFISPDNSYVGIVSGSKLMLYNNEEIVYESDFYNNKENTSEYISCNTKYDYEERFSLGLFWNESCDNLMITCDSDIGSTTFHILNLETYEMDTYCHNLLSLESESAIFTSNFEWVLYLDFIDIDNNRTTYDGEFICATNVSTGKTYKIDKRPFESENFSMVLLDDKNIRCINSETKDIKNYNLDEYITEKNFVNTYKVNCYRLEFYLDKINVIEDYNYDCIIFYNDERIDEYKLINAIEDYTGWIYDIKDLEVIPNDKIKITIGNKSTIFTDKFNQKNPEYYTDDKEKLVDSMLNNLKTNMLDYFNYTTQDLAICFCAEDDKPIYIEDLGVKIPTDSDYKGFHILNYTLEDKNSEQVQIAKKAILNELSTLSDVSITDTFVVGDNVYAVIKFPNYEISYHEEYELLDETYKCSYELWKYSDSIAKRLVYGAVDFKINDYKEYDGASCLLVTGGYSKYLIKYKDNKDNLEKREMIYECEFSEYKSSGQYTCFINNDESVCVIDNNDNIIFNKIIKEEGDEEDFWYPTVRFVSNYNFNKALDKVYIVTSVNYVYELYVADLITKKLKYYGYTVASQTRDVINYDKDYVVCDNSIFQGDMDSHIDELNKKEFINLKLINIRTSEEFILDKNLNSAFKVEQIDDNTIKYINNFGEEVTMDISKYVSDDREQIKQNIIDFLNNNEFDSYSEKVITNMQMYNVADEYYAKIDLENSDGSSLYELWHYNKDGKISNVIPHCDNMECLYTGNKIYVQWRNESDSEFVSIVNGAIKFIADMDDIKFVNMNTDYICGYDLSGNVIVIDNNDNIIMYKNILKDIDVKSENNLEISLGVLCKDSKHVVLLIKDTVTNMLEDIFIININDNIIEKIPLDINCKYDELFLNLQKGFIIYNSYDAYDSEGNTTQTKELHLYAYNLFNKKQLEVTKGEASKFYFFINSENEIEYYAITMSGSYATEEELEGTFLIPDDFYK